MNDSPIIETGLIWMKTVIDLTGRSQNVTTMIPVGRLSCGSVVMIMRMVVVVVVGKEEESDTRIGLCSQTYAGDTIPRWIFSIGSSQNG